MASKDGDKGAKLVAQERRVRVLELRKSGASIRAIATHLKELGYDAKASPTTVHRDLTEAFKNLQKQELIEANELRQLELERIDALWLAHWALGLKANIASSWVLIALSKRRSELIGMDATKKNINLNLTKEELEKMTDDELDELIKQLER